jgi:hypothetical protein
MTIAKSLLVVAASSQSSVAHNISTTARVRPLWHACAESSMLDALNSHYCSCAASAERLCRPPNVIRVIFQQKLVCGLCSMPVQNVQSNMRNISTIALLLPLQDADAEYSISYALYVKHCSCTASVECLCRRLDLICVISQPLLLCVPGGAPLQLIKLVIINSYYLMHFLDPHSFVYDILQVQTLWGGEKHANTH